MDAFPVNGEDARMGLIMFGNKQPEVRNLILDPRSQRAGSYKIGAVIVNV